MHSQTDTQRRVLKWTNNSTQLQVNTRTMNAVITVQRITLTRTIVFVVKGVFVIIHIVRSQGNTQVETVVDVEGHVEVILVDAAPFTRQEVTIYFVRNDRVIIMKIIITLFIYQPALVAHRSQPAGGLIRVNIFRAIDQLLSPLIVQILLRIGCLLRHIAHLRHILSLKSAQQSLHGHVLVERITLLVVESDVEITQVRTVTKLCRKHEAQVVERPARLVHIKLIALIVTLRTGEGVAKRCHQVVAPVNTYTGRIRADGRYIATQGTHGSAHTHKAGRTVQLTAGYLCRIVNSLRIRTAQAEHSQRHYH